MQALQDESEAGVTAERASSIGARIAAITSELSIIETVLVAVGGAFALDSVFSDDDRDITPPVITVLGDNPATVERTSVYADAGATAELK